MTVDLTVLIPTLNRASTLRTTLEALTKVRRDGISVEFVVIDNGSTDGTPAVLEQFRAQLPLTCLTDPVTGKSHALNHALNTVELGAILVFTDDDITPGENWLEAIVGACRRWPKHDVFGGPIQPVWPAGWVPPEWTKHDMIQMLAFARHDCGEEEREYAPDMDPFGGNFWVRRSAVLGAKFDERIGAHATRQKLGDETQFLQQLRRRGLTPMHVPGAKVKHRIDIARTTWPSVLRRAVQGGLGAVYVKGLPSKQLFQRSRRHWRMGCLRFMTRQIREFPGTLVGCDQGQRIANTARFLWSMAELSQALRLSFVADEALMRWISHCPDDTASRRPPDAPPRESRGAKAAQASKHRSSSTPAERAAGIPRTWIEKS